MSDPTPVGDLVARLSEDGLAPRERVGLLARLGPALATGARTAGARAAVSGAWLADALVEVGPRLPVRDLLTLREHHEGLSGDALAQALISSASRTTAAIGAAGGVLTAAAVAAPPTLLAAPFKVAAETLAVVAVEVKLVAELHVVYGRAPQGNRAQQATAWLSAWVTRRGLDAGAGGPGLAAVLGAAAKQQLRSRMARRLGRQLSTLAPFLAGAAAGAELNRRATRSLGDSLVRDLRRP